MTKTKTAKKTVARKTTKGTKAAAKKSAPEKKANAKPAVNGKAKTKKLSALDAAAKVLHDAKNPMTTKEMIDVMAAKKLWSSPDGKTPHATLYSAILREIGAKGKEARFKKSERGKFTSNN
jgi:hypothetical protein